MRIDKDISELRECLDSFEGEFWDEVAEVGREAIADAKENGEYKNHTHNLRNAPGYAVVKDGEILEMEVPTDGNHPEARKETENFLIYGDKPESGLILADGMPYASFVESKGFDVLSGAAIRAEIKLNKKMKS